MAYPFPSTPFIRIAMVAYLLASMVCGLCQSVHAQTPIKQTIVLNTSPNGFAPYAFVDTDLTPKGIVYDVAHRVLKKLGHKLVAAEVPRKRVEMQLLAGELDATPRAMEWSDNAAGFLFSDPIIRVHNTLLVRTDSSYTSVKELHGRRLATRLGYVYPVLTRELESGQLIRTDTTSDLSMLKMLQAKRVEAVLVDEAIARWLFQREGITDLRFLQEVVDSGVELRLMFAPRHRSLVKDFNRELANLKRSGELATITTKYLNQ